MALVKGPDLTEEEKAGGWARLPGQKTRNFVSTVTGREISRRTYDENIGRLKQAGIKTNEAQAKKNRAENELEQLARPARGRKKLDITEADQREANLLMRRDLRLQKEQSEFVRKKIESDKKRAARKSKSKGYENISDRVLKPGHYSARLEVTFSFDGYRAPIDSARNGHNHIVMYGIGVNGVHETTGKELTMWIDLYGVEAMVDIDMPFTFDNWLYVLEQVQERGYFVPVSGFVHFAFDKQYAENRKKAYLRKKGKSGF